MSTQLGLYNQALFLLKQRELPSIETGTSRETTQKKLDVIWDNGALDKCLSVALWNFATRVVELTYSPSITPAFGLKYAFDKPSDWIKTAALCTDEYFYEPCLDYKDMSQYWLSDYDTLYIEYVSNDSQYGGDMSLFPELYEAFVAAYLAKEVASVITGDGNFDNINAKYAMRLSEAKANDASNQPTKFPASGRWVSSRKGSRGRSNRNGRY